jgi:hypothetical protein
MSFRNSDLAEEFPDIASVRWDRLRTLGRFHRVAGFVWDWLSSSGTAVPQDVLIELSAEAASIASSNLRVAAESRNLQADFREAGVPLLFLKGMAVGALAYRNPSLKSAIDIDLLIDPPDLLKAAELLGSRGYAIAIPSDARTLGAWHNRSKESVWVNHQTGLQIDLHTRSVGHPRLIPRIDVRSPSQRVAIRSGISLPTFADEELFAYLAVHGAWSAWYRIKWLSDFAALLHGRPPDEIERLHRRSIELGAARSAGQALLLADRLFGTLRLAPGLRKRLEQDRTTRRLARAAFRMLASEGGEPTERPIGTLKIHYLELLVVPGLGFKISEIARQAAKFARNRA